MLIGLLSCHQPFAEQRRNLCRETWIPQALDLGFDVVFIMGRGRTRENPPAERDGDLLLVSADDGYRELPQKTRAFCEWAITTGHERFFKADDDTILAVHRFAQWLDELPPEVEYAGNKWRTDAKPYASGGAGYLLSRRAAGLVAAEVRNRSGYEDVLTGTCMKRNHIEFHVDHRFIAFGNAERVPLADNDLITSHKIPEPLWRHSWGQVCASGA